MINLTALLATALVGNPLAAPPVTTQSLLQELADPLAITRFPEPAFTLLQSSSYDRDSVKPGSESWFANNDFGKFSRVWQHAGRNESVMVDVQGPGAVVRVWSPNPKGTMRVYLDGADTPVLEAPMAAMLDGTALFGTAQNAGPIAGTRSRGWNLFVPIPFAKRCVVTTDDGAGVYYQVNWRAYPVGTPVTSFARTDVPAASPRAGALSVVQVPENTEWPKLSTIAHGAAFTLLNEAGHPGCIKQIVLIAKMDPSRLSSLSTLLLRATFDDQLTVDCPATALCSWAPGAAIADARRTVVASPDGTVRMVLAWPMPFARSVHLELVNTGAEAMTVGAVVTETGLVWDNRTMHFHAKWQRDRALHSRPMRDFQYLSVKGKGVYAGDSLQVMNPVDAWWGEGDEKIWVDGEKFPSHFGTGTEDYYGYGWCCPDPFTHPLHSQPLCDGHEIGSNWGRTIVTRLRGLDGIPYEKSLNVDMEVWHWAECDISYSPTAFWYALPGGSVAGTTDLAEVARGDPPVPSMYKLPGVFECERLPVSEKSDKLELSTQGMKSFGADQWSSDRHLWVRATRVGDYVELAIPAPENKPMRVTLYATKSWDYATVWCTINGVRAGEPIDLCSLQQGKAVPTGPIDLGVHTPGDGVLRLRVTVVSSNERSMAPKYYFGLDAVSAQPTE